ncbi:proline/serine-rich coiled-coil protein 1 [Struthio camelus]|uniref:proline/serine-rich coiled-coil protein 1 n=1 Tax=Struthio camelus TaxID=8801 RepID=UPI00360406B4
MLLLPRRKRLPGDPPRRRTLPARQRREEGEFELGHAPWRRPRPLAERHRGGTAHLASGAGYRAPGTGHRGGTGHRTSGTGYRAASTAHRVPGTAAAPGIGYQIPDIAHRVPSIAAAPGTGHRVPGRPWAARRVPLAETEAMTDGRGAEFITEETFDFALLSPSDSREEDRLDGEEEEEDEGRVGGPPARPARGPAGDSGRWSPLSGDRLEEMVREANRLAGQLQRCRLPRREPASAPVPAEALARHRLAPGPGGSPRSPRRETFVVKDSPVRALLPTVEAGVAPSPAAPRAKAAARPGAGDPLAKKAPGAGKDPPGCRPAPKGPPIARVPPSRVAPARPGPLPSSGAASRGKSEPLRAGTAGRGRRGQAGCPNLPPAPAPASPSLRRPGEGERRCRHRRRQAPSRPRRAAAPGQGHRQPRARQPPARAQRHPQAARQDGGAQPGPGGESSAEGQRARAQR